MQSKSLMEASRSPASRVVPVPRRRERVLRDTEESVHGSTPLFTRHMRGVIEAERDERGRRPRDGRGTFRRRSSDSDGRPPTHAALAAVDDDARIVTQATPDLDRWTDEGGSFDPETVARLRATASRR